MKLWQKEIDYIYDNIKIDRYDADSFSSIKTRYEFDYFSTIYSKFNYYFVILNFEYEVMFFIHYENKKTEVIFKNEFSIEKESKLFDCAVNFFARKMYYDKLLDIKFCEGL